MSCSSVSEAPSTLFVLGLWLRPESVQLISDLSHLLGRMTHVVTKRVVITESGCQTTREAYHSVLEDRSHKPRCGHISPEGSRQVLPASPSLWGLPESLASWTSDHFSPVLWPSIPEYLEQIFPAV